MNTLIHNSTLVSEIFANPQILSRFAKVYEGKNPLLAYSRKFMFLKFFMKAKILSTKQKVLKGNPNYQGMLSWIIQIFHYYCRKQYKNIENSRIIEQNLVLSLPFSLFTAACASCHLPQWQNFKHHKWSFVPYILSSSGWKWFSPS